MNSKLTGSEVFDTNVIKTDEYVLLAKVMVENGLSVPRAQLDIQAIDDMLSMQRMRAIVNSRRFTEKGRLRKDSSLLDMYDNRLNLLIEQQKRITMIKHTQTRLSTGKEPHLRGNCFPTVLACIMEMPVEEVIQIQEYYDDENWPCILDDWLLSKGWQLMTELNHVMDGSYYLVSGISPRNSNIYHVCIYQNGKIFHDPHPSNDGIVGELYFYSFNKIQDENRS